MSIESSGDPWAMALDALFNGPGSAPAAYRDGNDVPTAIRVILGQPDRADAFGRSQIIQASHRIEIRNSDIACPVSGAIVAVGGTVEAGRIVGGKLYELFGEPIGDLEGLSHACGANPL